MTRNAAASEIVDRLLTGMSLDTIRAFSVVLVLGFFRHDAEPDEPVEAWLSVSGRLCIESETGEDQAGRMRESVEFFECRANALSQLYMQIGKEVSSAHVTNDGKLVLALPGHLVTVERDGEDLDEVWAVMSDSPDPNASHRCYVSLSSFGGLSVQSRN